MSLESNLERKAYLQAVTAQEAFVDDSLLILERHWGRLLEEVLQQNRLNLLWDLAARVPVDCARFVLDALAERQFPAPELSRARELQAVPPAGPVSMPGFLAWSREHLFSCQKGSICCGDRWQSPGKASYAECSLEGRWLLASHSTGDQRLSIALYDEAGQVRWKESAYDYDCELSPCGRYVFLALEKSSGRDKVAQVLELESLDVLFQGQGWSLAEPLTSERARVSNGKKGVTVDFGLARFLRGGP